MSTPNLDFKICKFYNSGLFQGNSIYFFQGHQLVFIKTNVKFRAIPLFASFHHWRQMQLALIKLKQEIKMFNNRFLVPTIL